MTYDYDSAGGTDGAGNDVALIANTAPDGVDDSYPLVEDNPLSVAAPGVLANDSDANSDPITAVLVDAPVNAASFQLNADGSFAELLVGMFVGLAAESRKANMSSCETPKNPDGCRKQAGHH